jgi:iron complex outermembrane receptor protein
LNKLALTALLSATTVTAFGQNAPDKVETVVVTGTLIRGIAPIGAPSSTVDNAAIVASGTTNTADLLATQPALNSFNTLPIGGNQAFRSTGATVPGMRGLPGTAVLVLLDGHRLVGDSPLLTTADPSSIPAGAIERVEIIQDGGSATYGSDAVAGVINIILKKDFSGAESTGSYTSADGYDSRSLGQTFGKTWTGGSALLSMSYESNSDLLNSDRNYYTQDLRKFGGRNGLNISCGASAPGVAPSLNVLLDNGTWFNSSNLARLPVTTGGALTPTTPARNTPPGVAQAVTCDPALNNQLINPVTKYAAVANFRHDLNERVHLFADAKFTDTDQSQRYQPTNLVVNDPTLNVPGSRQTSGTLIIPGTNPFFLAPPGYTVTPQSVEQVFVNSRTFGAQGDVFNYFKARSYMLDVGATSDLWGDWQVTGDLNFGYSTSSALNLDSTGPNPNALLAAANGTTAGTALDPFGGRTDPNVVAGIMDWPLLFDATQKIYDLNVKADGSLFDLPGGAVKLAVGAGNRHEKYNGRDPIGVQGQPNALDPNEQNATRVVSAVNAELAIPLFGAPNAMPGLERLQLSLAGRYDHYDDVGDTFNPKYGLVWSPIPGLSLRGSYGTSFHAPQLADSFAIDTRATANVTTGGTIVPTNFPASTGQPTLGFAGGQPDLMSETAKTMSFGIDFKPDFVPGLSMSVSYFDIDYKNQVIIPQNNPASINNPALAGTVFVYNQVSTTGCSPSGAPVAAGTGGPCYGPIPQETVARLLDGVRTVNFTGVPNTWFITDLRRTNLGANLIQGWDFDFNYHHELGDGMISGSLSGEYLTKFAIQSAPGGPYNDALTSGLQYFQNDAGAQSIIPWHARATTGWQQGNLSTQVAVSYTGNYYYLYTPVDYSTNPNGASLPNRKQSVSPFITVDLNAIWDFPNQSGFLQGLRAQLNVYNILGEEPPLQYSTGNYGGFATPSASPLGRTFRISLTKRW